MREKIEQIQNFDLARLTLAGWVLGLTSTAVFLVGVWTTINAIEGSGEQELTHGGLKLLSIACLVGSAVTFIAGRWLLGLAGIRVYRDRKKRKGGRTNDR